MFNFAESEHTRAQRAYEKALGEAKASDPDARAARRQRIEDELVEEGLESVNAYEKTLDERWERANCLAEYDGLRMAYAIASRARKRIEEGQS